MKKSIVFSAIAVLILSVAVITGCNVVANTTVNYTTIGTTPATGTVTGRVTTPDAILSGSVTKSGDTFTVSLNSIIAKIGSMLTADAISITDAARFRVFLGMSAVVDSTFTPVSCTLGSTTASKIDMVFIMDNTGSMSGRIKAVKDSIAAFASNLEAAKADVKFGVVSFGDDATEQSSLDVTANATQVAAWLTALSGVGGGDTPENPLDSIMAAYSGFTWRADAQKVFIVVTDNPAHQVGDGTTYTSRMLASVEASLNGKASVYVVSPKIDYGTGGPWSYGGTADTRWMADGYGWYVGATSSTYGTVKGADQNGVVHNGTGGKWLELPGTDPVTYEYLPIDFSKLGIATTVTKGYTLIFTRPSTITGTVWYIYVQVDLNGDGVWDADGLITVNIALLSSGRWLPNGQLSNPAAGVKGPSKN